MYSTAGVLIGGVGYHVHDSNGCLAKAYHRSLTLTNIVLLADPNRACLRESDEISGHTC